MFICVCVPAVLRFSVSLLRAYTVGAMLITSCLFTTHSVVDKTHKCTQTSYGARMEFYQNRGLWQRMHRNTKNVVHCLNSFNSNVVL